jgi:hypothetical protein
MTVGLESVTFTSGDGATRVPSYLASPGALRYRCYLGLDTLVAAEPI